jgi:hypothetical protein
MSDPHLANSLFLLPAFLPCAGALSRLPCSFGFVEALESEAETVG